MKTLSFPEGAVSIFFVDPEEIVERVAAQIGASLEDVRNELAWNDEMAIATFTPGNSYNRKHLH